MFSIPSIMGIVSKGASLLGDKSEKNPKITTIILGLAAIYISRKFGFDVSDLKTYLGLLNNL